MELRALTLYSHRRNTPYTEENKKKSIAIAKLAAELEYVCFAAAAHTDSGYELIQVPTQNGMNTRREIAQCQISRVKLAKCSRPFENCWEKCVTHNRTQQTLNRHPIISMLHDGFVYSPIRTYGMALRTLIIIFEHVSRYTYACIYICFHRITRNL